MWISWSRSRNRRLQTYSKGSYPSSSKDSRSADSGAHNAPQGL